MEKFQNPAKIEVFNEVNVIHGEKYVEFKFSI